MSRSSIHRNDSDAPAITKMPTRISAEMRHSEGKLVALNQKNRLFLSSGNKANTRSSNSKFFHTCLWHSNHD
jgi:hypothetical protein